jgi:hypothetical protein
MERLVQVKVEESLRRVLVDWEATETNDDFESFLYD